jgi:gluconolactonase
MKPALLPGLVALTLGFAAAAHADLNDAQATRVDLTTREGAAIVAATWRYSDTRIVPATFPGPDAQGQPYGAPQQTYDLEPHAGAADFDDGSWAVIDPTTLTARRGNGLLSFNWYRVRFTIPERIGAFATRGAALYFETRLDDYAEVWIDGELARPYAGSGGSVVAGWNALNRVLVTRHAHPGQAIQLAIFGMNGPISNTPTNYIYVREAALDFVAGSPGPVAVPAQEVNVHVERLDPRIDAIVPANAKLFKLAEGFIFTEGPVWVPEGYLLFSDPNHNTIYKYTEAGELSVFRDKSGYDAADLAEYGQPGSNGLTLDAQGRLTINEHGRHRVSRLEHDGSSTVLAQSYRGKRLNSPNDLVYRSDGSLYFTDPPFGLPKFYDDPRKELDFSGVYRWKSGALTLLSRDLKGPNGIAFSPDEKYLYVGNWDPAAKTVTRHAVRRDGTLAKGETFIDLTRTVPGEEALDGLKVDRLGNVYLSAPGGVWIFAADGSQLGKIRAPRPVHNFAWGGADGKTLYLTARDTLYRTPLLVEGVRP